MLPETAAIDIVVNSGPVEAAFRRKVGSTELDLTFGSIHPIHRAFAPMVNDAAFDVAELAIVTAMQGVVYESPIVVLPVTLAARFQHKCIVYNRERGRVTPAGLAGQRVGVRAYSQTTGAWVRTILEHQFGVESSSIDWITQEPPHVRAATEPDNVHRDPDGRPLLDMLRDGTIVAAIFGNDLPDADWIAPVIENPDEAAREAFKNDGIVPINHVLSVSRRFADHHPDAVRRIYETFVRARDNLEGVDKALYPIGFDEMRRSVELMLELAPHHGLLPRKMAFEEFFKGATELLG